MNRPNDPATSASTAANRWATPDAVVRSWWDQAGLSTRSQILMSVDSIQRYLVATGDLGLATWAYPVLVSEFRGCGPAEHHATPIKWHSDAQHRAGLIRKWCWNEAEGFSDDYHFGAGLTVTETAAVATYPDLLGAEELRWMYPAGWASLQVIPVSGLEAYGFDQARDLARRFVSMVVGEFGRTRSPYEKYNVIDETIALSNDRLRHHPLTRLKVSCGRAPRPARPPRQPDRGTRVLASGVDAPTRARCPIEGPLAQRRSTRPWRPTNIPPDLIPTRAVHHER